jgi:hypothetical protein
MKLLGPREREALPFVLIVLGAFLFGLAFLVVSILVGM